MWSFLLTSPNSCAKIHGGDLRPVKTISVFIFSFGVFFSSFQFILSTLSSDTRDLCKTKLKHQKPIMARDHVQEK